MQLQQQTTNDLIDAVTKALKELDLFQYVSDDDGYVIWPEVPYDIDETERLLLQLYDARP